jgi:hypothetical protein
MNNAGRSVLWFLGACLVLVHLLAGIGLKFTDPHLGPYVLVFGFLCLISILVSLLLMYHKDPSFLMAERDDVRFLSVLRSLADRSNPELLAQVIKHIDVRNLKDSQIELKEAASAPDDSVEGVDEVSQAVSLEEREEFAASLQSLPAKASRS